MRIAILGGSGFLGKYVVETLKNKNYIPIILTRGLANRISLTEEYRVTDYSKDDLVKKLKDIDAIVHLAAKRGSQGQISEFHECEIITQNLYEACYELGIKNIVFASTISVYSDQKQLPWCETQVPSPKLMYGISKLTCEHIGNLYSEKCGLKIKNLRFAHLYGFNEKNNYMINLFFRKAFNKEQLRLNTISISKREFLYAKDAAKAIELALSKKNLRGTFNIGSGIALTNFEVAQSINEVFDNNKPIFIIDENAVENITESYMDISYAKNELDFSPDYLFKDAVKEIFELMKELDNVPILY